MRQARMLVLIVLLASAAAVGAADTYTVTSAGDSGPGTLRQAILDANAHMGADTITFNIVGSGVQTIALASALPVVTDSVTINGYSQPGASANTRPVGQGLDTVLTIEIVGTGAGSCLGVSTSDTTVKGLAVHGCSPAIVLNNGAFTNNKVEGCFVGTDAAGTTRLDGGFSVQVSVVGESGATVGGSAPAARNLLSACQEGVALTGAGSGHTVEGNLVGLAASGDALLNPPCAGTSYNVVVQGGSGHVLRNNVVSGGSNGISVNGTGHTFKGNFVGTDVTGTVLFGLGEHGFAVSGTNHVIGGAGPGEGNIVAGASFYNGLELNGSGHVVYGNFIGTDPSGTIDLGNLHAGIVGIGTDLTIGGVGAGEGNTIAFNSASGYAGVLVQGQRVRIRGNRIYSNHNGLGIDLFVGSLSGVTPNDPGDGDGGPNGAQNYPILISAGPAAAQGSGTHITGVLNSTASTIFEIDFYSNPACANRPQEFLEGEEYIGSTQVTTDGSGDASFDITLPVSVDTGARIAATATDPDGNTSEFSQRLVFSMSPTGGSPAGGTAVSLAGMLFADGATVTIGAIPATGVTVVSPTKITATTPSLVAGTRNDVIVTNLDGTGGVLVNGWVADFLDVDGSHPFHSYVTKLVANAITAGVGGGFYGVDLPTLREQMAVFLLKAKHGLCFTPPPCQGIFDDVPCPATAQFPYSDWIEELAAEQITAGCDVGKFCPEQPVQRDQMAVFLLKTEHGHDYVPPSCTGVFADVSCPDAFAVDWIEQLYDEQITGGCLTNPLRYCPTNANSRGEMAVFQVKTFGLP